MSGYRSYVPWTKNAAAATATATSSASNSGSLATSKKEAPSGSATSSSSSKYESSAGTRSRSDVRKVGEDKGVSALPTKYGSAYGSGYQRDTSSTRDTSSSRSDLTSRIKSPIERDKKESHPPVSYRPLLRTVGSRSRDPSPAEREKTESSSNSFNYNRLYPKSYTKSLSREKLDVPAATTTIPKYTGRSSLTKDDYGKYTLGRTSRNSSREDLSLAKYKPPETKEEILAARFSQKRDELKYAGRTTSREDLTKSAPKYITSRFLPKNTIEKSHTAYLRPSTRTSEVSRKNRELLNTLSTQHEDKRTARTYEEKPKEVETMVTMVTRSTSPTPPTGQGSQLRKRGELSRMSEKQVPRSKVRVAVSEKEAQTEGSKIGNPSRTSAAPWSSYLDVKYSSPKESESSQSESPKSISRNSSSKSLSRSSSKGELKVKSKLKAPSKKLLPPQIPNSRIPNKDFRKSVLNMNPESTKLDKRSGSASSARSSSSESSSSSADEGKVKVEEASKSFLMRALAPVTGLFKAKEEVSTSDNTDKNISELPSDGKLLNKVGKLRLLRHVDSGERAWWLDDKAEPPEGVVVYPPVAKTSSDDRSLYVDSEATDKGISDLKSTSEEKLRLICKANGEERSWWAEESSSSKGRIKLLRHVESGERAWWLDNDAPIPEGVQVHQATSLSQDGSSEEGKLVLSTKSDFLEGYKIRHIDSGERPWWYSSVENVDEFDPATLGDRASPEGLETPRDESEDRKSPYDNVPVGKMKSKLQTLFISKHTNIDDILGGSTQLLSPLMDRIFSYQCPQEDQDELYLKIEQQVPAQSKYLNDIDPFSYTTNFPDPPRPPLHTFSVTLPLINQLSAIHRLLKSPHRLDDAALQLYKDGDYGSYLDLDASISEQQEEFDGFQTNKKNSIVLRTQLSVRVHTIIEKLLTSEGRELRRALFSLKQIFQEDKDLVHEFVQNDGLACLIKVGSEADQNYQNYILRALGQVMLYVDGMNGVMEHNQTVQWLYTLISSKFRLVVKTALKLLLVFVEYTDSNCMLLIKAIHAVDTTQGLLPWYNVMRLLKDFDSADTELLIYATTLVNKCLNGVPDQDTYYDQTDALEEQGIENIIQRYMSKPGTDLDLLQQFQIYEAVLQYEDGEDKSTPIRHLDESIRKTLRSRKSLVDSAERRKSRRHSTGTTPVHSGLSTTPTIRKCLSKQSNDEDDESSSSQSTNGPNHQNLNGSYKDPGKVVDAGVTPALRRRRERAERQRSFMKEQQENATLLRSNSNNDSCNENGNYTNGLTQRLCNANNVLNRNSSKKDLTERLNAANKLDSEENGVVVGNNKQPWIMADSNGGDDSSENDRKLPLNFKKENTVKDLTQKLASQNIILHSPSSDDGGKPNRIEGMTGLINKAKEGLAKSKSQANVVVKSPTGDNLSKATVEVKKSENELRWEELVLAMERPLNLCDMDFTDLSVDDETSILAPVSVSNGVPPPPPPLDLGPAPPPPPRTCIPPPVPSPPVFFAPKTKQPVETKIPTVKKNKKTVKLFWKEVRDDPVTTIKLKTGYIWDELNPVNVDTQKLEHLFESRAKDLINKKQQEMNKNKEIIVLDPKRSNAINIGMTKLPPPRSIKTAILKMDATIMNREGIEKLLTMLPTEEERTKIQEAQAANPDLPLGSAEQFLLTLASISELPARLRLWAFKLDFENTEREIAEPLMDLKQGFEVLRVNKTFRGILSTLLSIGNFLNGAEVKGFQIEYLSKVPEVKDTVHKHSLLHHLCHIVMEKFPDATDLYSEIGAITRASKVDFDELSLNIQRLEADCKASWDYLKLIAKHDGSTMKAKMSDFLADCAERIILVGIIHRRVMNRFHKFLLWLGIPLHQIADTKPNEFCRIVSEFALEYRTTRERVLQQLEKKANHRERNKTRGKMITETAKFRTKEDRADAELRQLLGSDISDVESLQGTLPFRRTRKDANRSLMGTLNGHFTDGDDEIIESLVKTATKAPSSRTAPRERKRTRHADRKSLRRTLKNGLSEEEKKHLSAYIKGY